MDVTGFLIAVTAFECCQHQPENDWISGVTVRRKLFVKWLPEVSGYLK